MAAELWQIIGQVFDFLLHVDIYLHEWVAIFGVWVYVMLFLIVFCETGLVVTPFLPGDSLLFVGGTLAGAGMLEYPYLVITLLSAAIAGDAVNFAIGKYIGPPVFEKNYRWLKPSYLEQAHAFYEKHGGKAIILARFIPIIRTFAPFIAGVASMNPGKFLFFNISGALIWVFSLVTLGYMLGNNAFVQQYFSFFIYGIIGVSLLPVLIEWCSFIRRKNKQPKENKC